MLTLPIDSNAKAQFAHDGFLIFDNLLETTMLEPLREAMAASFDGKWETGLAPDEVNWRPGHPDHVTRQICNVWKASRTLASVILSAKAGQAVAALNGWPGTRVAQDNLLHKPAEKDGVAGGTLGMHQDSAFADWADPSLMCTVWLALDDVSRAGGTLEFARSSHKWAAAPPIDEFHNPTAYRSAFEAAAARQGIVDPEMAYVEVPAGGGSIHHGWTWHGSGPNKTGRPRRAIAIHCISSDAVFTDQVGYIYSRYKQLGSNRMDEGFFPIIWHESGHRSAFIAPFLAGNLAWHACGS